MITAAFTCTGPYVILILTGIKAVENRSQTPVPGKGRCAISCSKKFCAEEYGRFVEWASRSLPPKDFERIPAWVDVKDWPGKVVGCCDYAARPESAPYRGVAREPWDEGYPYWWDLSEVTVLERPIPCRGNVGMWEMPPDLAAQVTAADELARSCEVPVRTVEAAAKLFRLAMPVVGGVEGFFVLPLDGERRPIAAPILASLGTESNTTTVDVGDVFREALAVGAEAMIVAHNHPGGTLRASADDLKLTRVLQNAAELLGVKLLDHLIVTGDGFVRCG